MKSLQKLFIYAQTPNNSGQKIINFKKWKRWTSIIGVLIGLGAVWLWQIIELPVLSPLSKLTSFTFLTGRKSTSPKIVYAFLPYWNQDIAQIDPAITNLAYFSLTIGPDGNVITRQDGGAEPGYHKLTSDDFSQLTKQLTHNPNSFEIVLTQFNNQDIQALLANQKSADNLMVSLDSILLAMPVTGINLDIEYTGQVSPQLRQQLVELVTKIRQHLDSKYGQISLSIDMYASAAEKPQIWDVPAIADQVDHIIVMAYDFHRQSSAQAGPVAPLYGANIGWNDDINHYLKAFLRDVPKEKIILGIPFYGYGWQTTSLEAQSNTYPDTGFTASYKFVQDLLINPQGRNPVQKWDDTALAPYITYIEDGNNYVIHYEDQRSIGYKMEYARQLDIAGVAIWAVGYEGEAGAGAELWNVVAGN